MPTVTIEIERDLEAKVKKFANGKGLEVSDVVESALKFALKTRYTAVDPGYGQGTPRPNRPNQDLPGSGARPDQGLPGSQPKPDQGLPGSQPRPDQGLPGSQPGIDNSLPGQGPGGRRCPVFQPENPEIDNELPEGEIPTEIPDQSLPETPEPK